MKPTVTRSAEMGVRLTEQVREGLQEVAEAVGMSPSALASYAIGKYVAEQKKQTAVYDQLPQLLAQLAAREAERGAQ